MIGHVANGKSTLVRQLTGTTTGQHSKEKKRNCTIALGYANCKIYQCCECCKYDYGPSTSSAHPCTDCGAHCALVRHVSFVDCPGHDQLISTMINGASVMDGAILVTAANESCPQPQTVEHLMASELLGVEHYVKVQNKVDLVPDERTLMDHAAALEELTHGTNAADAPLIPVVAQTGVNMDALVEAIATCFPIPSHNLQQPLRMQVIRTFKVSKPGMRTDELLGGVLGGSIVSGVARVGDVLEIRPGLMATAPDGSRVVTPLYTRVQSLQCDKAQLEYAVPGGLIAIQTDLDPYLCMGDRLVGQVAGAPGSLPPVLSHLAINYQKLKRVTEEQHVKLSKGLQVVLHVGAAEVNAEIIKLDKKDKSEPVVLLKLSAPVCCDPNGQPVTIFVNKRLVGYGKTVSGKEVKLPAMPALEALMAAPTLRNAPNKTTNKPVVEAAPADEPVLVVHKQAAAVDPALFGKKKKKKAKVRGEEELAQQTPEPEAEETNPEPEKNAADEPADESTVLRKKPKKKKAFSFTEPEPEPEPEMFPLPEEEPAPIEFEQVDANADANRLLASCRFYEQELPEPGDIVTAIVDEVGKHGVHVSLPEYGGRAGFIPLSELTRKSRVKSIRKLVWPEQEIVCAVTTVDEHTGHIDLTKSRVLEEEAATHQAHYGEAVLAHQVLSRAAFLCDSTNPVEALLELYTTIAWPLAAEHEDTYGALLAAAKDPETVAAMLQPNPVMFETLVSEAQRRLKPRARKFTAEVRLHCMQPLGVHAVRAVLSRSQLASECVSIKVDVPPVYRLSCETETQVASRELWRAVRLLEAEAALCGCSFQIESEPHRMAGQGERVFLEEPETDPELDALLAQLSNLSDTPSELVAAAELVADEPAADVDQELAWLLEASQDNSEEAPSNSCFDTAEARQQAYQDLLVTAMGAAVARPSKLRLSALQILLRPKQTLVANFGTICNQLRRPLQHVMLYLTTELGSTGSIKGDGCGLVLRGRFKPNQVEVLVRKYCGEFVKCSMCGSFETATEHDQKIRSHVLHCNHCHASRTLTTINQPTYQAQVGRRKRA